MKLSVIIITKNEENSISDCLENLYFCDEIIIIDDNSTDATIKIAEKFGAKVYKRKLNDDYASQRNFGLEKASNEWVLFVDADERVTESLKQEIIDLLKEKIKFGGFYIKRKDLIWGKTLAYGETAKVRLLRLARKNAGKWKRKVHEYWEIKGKVGELENHLLHYPHQSISEFLNQINKYSTLHAIELQKEKKNSNLMKVLFWQKFKFLNNFIFKLGFLDGNKGLILSLMMSFHSFLSWSKLWISQKKLNFLT